MALEAIRIPGFGKLGPWMQEGWKETVPLESSFSASRLSLPKSLVFALILNPELFNEISSMALTL